jgi:hypothetical protein
MPAAIPVILSTAASAYGANQQRKAGKGAQRRWESMQPDVDYMRNQGRELSDLGSQGMKGHFGYLEDLASGSQSRLMQQLGPGLRQMGDDAAQSRQNIMQFAPRGGGAAALAAQNPMNLAQRQGETMLAARDSAQNKMGAFGSQMQGTGMNTFQGAFGNQAFVNTGINQAQQDQADAAAKIGEAFGDMMGGTDWGSIFGKSGMGSVPTGSNLSSITGVNNQNLMGVMSGMQNYGSVRPLEQRGNLGGLASLTHGVQGGQTPDWLTQLMASLGYRPGGI